MSSISIKVKRVYDPIEDDDGLRILVDRLWPRGVSKDKVDIWLKDIAPSNELRKWFSHDPKKWVEFKSRYWAELRLNQSVHNLLNLITKHKKVTLLFSARDREKNNAVVLREYIEEMLSKQ